MDGLIFDTERLSFVAWKAGAEAVGLEIDLPFFQSLIGMNSKAIQARLLDVLGANTDVAELTRVASLEYDKLLKKGPPLKPGARECLGLLVELGVQQALATSSSYRYASRKLIHHGLLEHFDKIVTGDQVTNGKPHPEPYLLAAQRLEIDPQHCIAFEDSVNGIRSAHDAGMYTILIPDMCPHDADSLSRVQEQFESLEHAKPFLEKTFDTSALR
ncbi:haloacid dehalogenase-like hydrolase, putative [Verrucomicrobiia bacterium DG1235]|nr:haloacid dehalogenase-like hydrolase, putative [Verrucomicrobiae bacterium DG1235]